MGPETGLANAAGARPIAPLIAAAANHGATCLIVLFMMLLPSDEFAVSTAHIIVALRVAGVVRVAIHSILLLAGIID
jgi:hypothetical protein